MSQNYWNRIPDWIKVGLWVGVSAAITYIGSAVLERPELAQYYGIVNIILFGIKELDKKVRRKSD
jgi:hypothetical protein